jgi:hypothetical protein
MNPLGLIYSVQFVLLLCFAAGYYKAAEIENASGMLWAGMSIVIFLITWRLFGWGVPGNLMGQGARLGGITAVRVIRGFKDSS